MAAKLKTDIDPVVRVAEIDRQIEGKRQKIHETESMAGDPESIIAAWMRWCDEQSARFWTVSTFLNPPSRDNEIVSPAGIEGASGLVIQTNLYPLIAGVGGEELKERIAAFIHAHWPKEWITEDQRTMTKAKLDEELFELECERERLARHIERIGGQIDRPENMNPEIFLAAEL